MSSAWILTIALMGPPPHTAVPESATHITINGTPRQAVEVKDQLKPDEIRERYVSAMQRAAKHSQAKPEEVVLDLVQVYAALGNVQGIAHSEVRRMRGVVKARLLRLRSRLIRDNIRRRKELDRNRRRFQRQQDGAVSNRPVSLAGASEIDCANQLIELIQTMIEPQTWEANGGTGTIRYFPMLKVLVIRQTLRVHEQIGGVLGGLKK